MRVVGNGLLFAAISLAQVCSGLPSRRALETAASATTAVILWSEPIGRLESGETRANFTAFSVADPVHQGQQLRGVRVDIASPGYNGVVYVESTEITALKGRADWLAKMVKTYPNETAPFVIGGAGDDPPCPFVFTYQHTENNATLYLRGLGRPHQFEFAGGRPSELAAILARAAKALKR